MPEAAEFWPGSAAGETWPTKWHHRGSVQPPDPECWRTVLRCSLDVGHGQGLQGGEEARWRGQVREAARTEGKTQAQGKTQGSARATGKEKVM